MNCLDKKPPQAETIVESDVLTLREAASLLRIHPETLRKRAVSWGIPHRRLGTEWRFSRQRVEGWLQQHEAA